MADETYTTRIKIEADTNGGEAAAKSFEKAEAKAKGFSKAVGGVTKAVNLMRSALVGFGVVSLFTSFIGAVENLRKKFGEATGEADKLKEASEKAADKKRVEELTVAYDNLAKSIAAASKERERANELEDMALGAAREQEDINAEAAKAEELAALDPNDRYYEQKKAQIEAKYSGAAANRAAQRKVEDAERAAARTAAEAEAKGAEATQRSAALVGDRQQLDELKRRRSQALADSVSDNASDLSGAGETGWVNFTRFFGMNGGWARLGESRTDEGDAKRKAAEDKAAELEKQIKEKEKNIAEKERQIAELEKEASFLSNKSVIQSSLAENAKDAASVTRTSSSRAAAAAAAGLSGRIESENDAVEAKRLLEQKKAEIESQIAAQKQRVADAGMRVYAAQGAQSEAAANGDRRGAAAAGQQVASAQAAAQEVEYGANRLIASLTERLKQVTDLLSKANSAIAKNNQQRLTQQAEAVTAP